MKTIKNRKGFSLVELLVVITIIAILSVTAYSAFGGNTIKARDSKRVQDLSTIQSALELYYVEFSEYPTSLVSGSGVGEIPRKYLSTIPIDPKKTGGGVDIPYYFLGTAQQYVIGTTLENDGTSLTSYYVGNSDATTSGTGPDNCTSGVDITNCIPYDFD